MSPHECACIRVKALLIAPNEDLTAHAVSLHAPTREDPNGYHRLIGGTVEPGETHHDALVREIAEELGAAVRDLTYLTVVENIFRLDTMLGHEVVFLYVGRLDPPPALTGAVLTDTDGSRRPVVWRPFADEQVPVPLYPTAARPWVRETPDRLRTAMGS